MNSLNHNLKVTFPNIFFKPAVTYSFLITLTDSPTVVSQVVSCGIAIGAGLRILNVSYRIASQYGILILLLVVIAAFLPEDITRKILINFFPQTPLMTIGDFHLGMHCCTSFTGTRAFAVTSQVCLQYMTSPQPNY